MQKLWCWRCKMEIAMLDEEEFSMASELYSQGIRAKEGNMAERYKPLLDYYFQVTGEKETNPNAVMHHRINQYGPPCENCGKPYRTPKASFCAACGHKRPKMTIQSNSKGKYIIKSILFCLVFTLLLIIFSFAKGFIPNEFERLAHGIVGTVAAVLTTVLFLKFDRKKFSDIGLTFERSTIVKFFIGIIIGIVIMGLLATSVVYFANLRIDINPESNLLHFLVMTSPLLLLAFMEELGFRAYPLQILKDKTGIRLSIIITSILFAVYHLVNGWSFASAFYGPAVWGLVFGLSAIYSKGIAMPTGIHYAANLTAATIGTENNTVSIWIARQPESATTKYGGTDWITILPSLALLIFAIICIELYIRRKTTANSRLHKA